MRFLRLAIGLAVGFVGRAAHAAPIHYGDFSGTDVMYLDVTETANTPGEAEPLFGPPTIAGNILSFPASNFSAGSPGPAADITDGQLNFTVASSGRPTILNLTAAASGVYTLQGSGGAGSGTRIGYAISLASVKVLDLDYAALAVPVDLAPASRSGGDRLASGSDTDASWGTGMFYDVNAALAAADVPFSNGATRLAIAMNFSLVALSEEDSAAVVAGKAMEIGVNAAGLPVPVLTIMPSGPNHVTLSWTPDTPGFVLQESPDMNPTPWSDAPSGSTNPVTLPIELSRKFYRLFRPEP